MSCTCGGVYPKEVGTCARCGRTDVPIANGSDQLFPHLRRIPEGKAFHAYLCKCREQRQAAPAVLAVPNQSTIWTDPLVEMASLSSFTSEART